jgi:uncharacterized damage-inducible protein DinB
MALEEQIKNALSDEILHRLYVESVPRILKCLDQLTIEQIWWRPNESSNSIGNLVLHLCGNVSQWISSGLGGYPDHRIRQQEFDQQGMMSKEQLSNILVTTMEQAKPIIRAIPVTELLSKRPVQTFEETGLSILVHVTEHFSYHTGQIAYITKMLSNKPLGFYDGITLA